jgi:hypothetical protein
MISNYDTLVHHPFQSDIASPGIDLHPGAYRGLERSLKNLVSGAAFSKGDTLEHLPGFVFRPETDARNLSNFAIELL